MSISKASRVTEAKRHFVIAIDDYKDGKISGVVYHMSHPEALRFESMMDLVWIVETVSDELSWPVSLMKQRNFKKVVPLSRRSVKNTDAGKVRRGKLATLKIKLNYRNFASWQGIVAWVDKEETRGFKSFLELVRFMSQMIEPENELGNEPEIQRDHSLICKISVDDVESSCIEGQIMAVNKSQPLRFRSVFELARNLDMMVTQWDINQLTNLRVEQRLIGDYYLKGKVANFVVRIRFYEHDTYQGTIFWKEMKQTVNFRSFLELVKLMDLAVMNLGQWTDEEKSQAASQ